MLFVLTSWLPGIWLQPDSLPGMPHARLLLPLRQQPHPCPMAFDESLHTHPLSVQLS